MGAGFLQPISECVRVWRVAGLQLQITLVRGPGWEYHLAGFSHGGKLATQADSDFFANIAKHEGIPFHAAVMSMTMLLDLRPPS